MIGALRLQGLLADSNSIGSTDEITFEAFICQKLVPKLGKGACVVMDNCSIHLRETVREPIKAAGAKLIYLPPYSPDFSPSRIAGLRLKTLPKIYRSKNLS